MDHSNMPGMDQGPSKSMDQSKKPDTRQDSTKDIDHRKPGMNQSRSRAWKWDRCKAVNLRPMRAILMPMRTG